MASGSRLSVAALLVGALLLTGCDRTSSRSPESKDTAPRRGGTIVIGSISDVDSWNEYLSRQSLAVTLLRRIYLRLAEETGDGRSEPRGFSPLLAESWSFSPDRLALTFVLREAQWSDGRPITSADVRFTWKAQISSEVPWIGAAAKQEIVDVEAVDERRVIFRFRRSYPYQLADAVDGGIIPEHLFSAVPFERWAEHDWSTVRVGSGPFLLDEHRPNDQISLRRNPLYDPSGNYPLVDRVVVRIVPDISNLITQLRAGEIDYLEGVSPLDARSLVARSDLQLVAFDYDYGYIGWNGSRPPFNDPQLRRAMTLAIDRQALVDELLHGQGRVAKAPVLSDWWGADRELEPWPYDPEEAKRILGNLGYALPGAPGQQTLAFEIMTNAGNRLREDVLIKIQEQLSRVGVQLRLSSVEMRTLRQRAGSGDYDAYLGGWVFAGKVDLRPLFGSDSTPPRGANVVFYRSAELDGMLSRLDTASDWQAMRPVLEEIQRKLHEEQPYTFLYEAKRLALHSARLRDVTIDVPSDPLARLERFWVLP